MNNKALLATTALILALSAVSCGKEDGESSVSIAYGESTRTTVTEESKQEKTTVKTTKAVSGTGTATATTTSAVSGTETTTTDTEEETSSETTTSAESSDATTTTATVADTTVQTETTAQTTTVATTAEVTTESTAPAPEETTSNDDNNNNDDDNNNTQTEETTTAPEPTTEAPTEDNTFEFKFTVDNLLNDAAGLLAMLGTPNYSGEAPGCTSNGNDVKIYQYDGLEIQCYIDGATEYIFSIEITGDKYVTDRGIKTGCTRAEVESAYGTGETSSNMTVYYTGNNEMDIEYDGDTVTSIFFYAPV